MEKLRSRLASGCVWEGAGPPLGRAPGDSLTKSKLDNSKYVFKLYMPSHAWLGPRLQAEDASIQISVGGH